MATKIKGNYVGNLRCSLNHLASDTTILTDAPVDNNGKGEAFSPTDLLAAGLGSCMLTILAIRANSKKIEIGHPEVDVEKRMKSSPREIEEIVVTISFKERIETKNRDYLEEEARNCPVALSLNSKIKQTINFIYD